MFFRTQLYLSRLIRFFFSSSSAKKTSNNEIYIQKPITLLKISQAYTILKANGSHKFF